MRFTANAKIEISQKRLLKIESGVRADSLPCSSWQHPLQQPVARDWTHPSYSELAISAEGVDPEYTKYWVLLER